MAKFTLIYRDLTTGMTGWHHALGEDLGSASEAFEVTSDLVDVELVGAFEGHITPLWWEE